MSLILPKAASIGDAAFNSHWWIKHQPKLTKAVCLIIQRSQRKLKVTVGGLWVLNLETYGSVSYEDLLFPYLLHVLFVDY